MAVVDKNTENDLELSADEIDELTFDIPIPDRRLITSSADFSVGTLVTMMREGQLTVPKFQRKYIWSDRKASRLIESLIIQCPIPVLYLNRRSDEILEVIDGNQRVNSLRKFLDGQYFLTGLTAFAELHGSYFDSLDQVFQRQIKNRTIRCVIVEPESNAQIKFDVFERLNSGSTPLSPQELRHGLNYGPLVKLLETLAKNKTFVMMTGLKNDKRMKGDELVLRFFAFRDSLANYQKPLSLFLSDYIKKKANCEPLTIKALEIAFTTMIDEIHNLLGADAFRFRGGETENRKFNTAYYDAITVGYATSALATSASKLDVDKTAIRERFEILGNDNSFRTHTLRATSDRLAIERRIRSAEIVFNEFA